jgi:predicted dehydrogenase
VKTAFRVGIVGCGNIFPAYARQMPRYAHLRVTACADLDLQRATSRAAEFSIPRACSVDELLADPAIDIVVNLTPPAVHAEVSLDAIAAGKHVYSEKPLADRLDRGEAILAAGNKAGVRVGCAPDTVLGGGIQTCRKLVEDGRIGQPVGAAAFVMSHGMEHWHPNPEFFYQPGAGPMMDMGPYYLTTLVNLIGPVRRVSGSASITFPERTVSSEPLKGTRFKVRTPTHIAGTIDFETGAIGTIITTRDVWRSRLPRLEVYGAEGTLGVPDPNGFGGPVYLFERGKDDWEEVPLTHPTDMQRGAGVADMAEAIAEDRPVRASGEMALHVLEVLLAFEQASESGSYVAIRSTCAKPEPLPVGFSFPEQGVDPAVRR